MDASTPLDLGGAELRYLSEQQASVVPSSLA
jgi:hypothetical protein